MGKGGALEPRETHAKPGPKFPGPQKGPTEKAGHGRKPFGLGPNTPTNLDGSGRSPRSP